MKNRTPETSIDNQEKQKKHLKLFYILGFVFEIVNLVFSIAPTVIISNNPLIRVVLDQVSGTAYTYTYFDFCSNSSYNNCNIRKTRNAIFAYIIASAAMTFIGIAYFLSGPVGGCAGKLSRFLSLLLRIAQFGIFLYFLIESAQISHDDASIKVFEECYKDYEKEFLENNFDFSCAENTCKCQMTKKLDPDDSDCTPPSTSGDNHRILNDLILYSKRNLFSKPKTYFEKAWKYMEEKYNCNGLYGDENYLNYFFNDGNASNKGCIDKAYNSLQTMIIIENIFCFIWNIAILFFGVAIILIYYNVDLWDKITNCKNDKIAIEEKNVNIMENKDIKAFNIADNKPKNPENNIIKYTGSKDDLDSISSTNKPSLKKL